MENNSTRCELSVWRFKQWGSNYLRKKSTTLGNVIKNFEF